MIDVGQLLPAHAYVPPTSNTMVLAQCIVHALANEVELAHEEWLASLVELEPRVELLERAGVALIRKFEEREREPIKMPVPPLRMRRSGG